MSSANFWLVTIITCAISFILFFIVRRYDFLFSDTIINSIMQNRFESNYSNKLYKKKLEEIRKFQRSVAKFKRLYKVKNEDCDNYSDKRLKDIVEGFRTKHQKKNTTKCNKPELKKRAKSFTEKGIKNDKKIVNKKILFKLGETGLETSKNEEKIKNIQFLDFTAHPSKFNNLNN